MLKIKMEDSGQKIAVFGVIESINYTSLEYRKFDIWNVKVDCEPGILDGLRGFQKTKDLLGKEWVEVMDPWISISSTKVHVRDQISLMEDGEEKE